MEEAKQSLGAFNPLKLFEMSCILKMLDGSTKIWIISQLNKGFHSLVYSGYSWKCIFAPD